MEELFATWTLLAIIGLAGYLVWRVESHRCRRCGSHLDEGGMEICARCYGEIEWRE